MPNDTVARTTCQPHADQDHSERVEGESSPDDWSGHVSPRADQAYDRSLDLMANGVTEIVVVDPSGKESPAPEFVRTLIARDDGAVV